MRRGEGVARQGGGMDEARGRGRASGGELTISISQNGL